MKKFILSIFSLIIASVTSAQTVTVSVDPFEIKPGETKTVSFDMFNTDVDIASAIVFVTLPEGLSFVQQQVWNADDEEYTYYYASLTDRKKSKFTIADNLIGNQLRVVINGMGQTFKNPSATTTTNAIFTFDVKANDDVKAGEYSLEFTDISFSNGEATLSFTPESFATVATVPSSDVKVTEITLDQYTIGDLETTKSVKLTATVLPDNATNKEVEWTSSDTSIATVDAEGNVSCLKTGAATITCTAKDGSGVSAKCEISITTAISNIAADSKSEAYTITGTRASATQHGLTIVKAADGTARKIVK